MTPRGAARRVLGAALAVAAMAALGACYDDVKVVQGTVIGAASARHEVEVRDEQPPHATATYRLARPATVAPGDLVRLAFRDRADGKVVVRLMNLSRHRAQRQTDKE
jgi:hypothetical protein